MVDVLALEWLPIIIVGFATFFLLGELLVNMRGVFALLGIVLITLYFYLYLASVNIFLIMFIIYFIGLLLVFIDGKFIGDGTLAVIGVISMMISVALTAPSFSSGLYAIIGLLIGGGLAFTLIKVFKKRDVWNKLTLKDRLTKDAGYTSLSEEYEQLVGKEGITLTDLRPSGTALIGDKQYSVVSSGQWIHKNTEVIVKEVDGTKILVKVKNN